jgi:exportin-1
MYLCIAGEIIRERTKDTDAIAQYTMMRETLVYLTHLDFDNTREIMLGKLAQQCDPHGGQFSWNGLNTLCWAVGSISGAMNQENEQRFLVSVIKSLLQLVEQKSGKDNKAVVASNIMYVVGQYPRFLRAHWKFLRTVVKKLFEFMHERHPGVQDMACDTFLKIAQKCRPMFVAFHEGEPAPFIDTLLQDLPMIVSDLEPHQVETFYEACGYMISAQKEPVRRKALLENLMAQPNQRWAAIMSAASTNIELLREPQRIRDCLQILKINTRVCHSLGHPFVSQLGNIYMDMLNVYRTFSEYISSQIAQGLMQTSHQVVKSMRSVKKETLRLIEGFVSRSEDPVMVARDLIQLLYDPVLGDYKRNMPIARDPEVLSLFTVVFAKVC